MAADEIIRIGIELDAKAAKRTKNALAKLEQDTKKRFQSVVKASKSMGRASSKVTDDIVEDLDEWLSKIGDVGKYYQSDIKQVKALQKAVERFDEARSKGDAASQKAATQRMAILKKELDKRKKAIESKASPGFDTAEMGKNAKDALKEAGDEFKSALSSFFQKDFKGMVTSGAKLTSKLSGGLARGAASKGAHWVGRGDALSRAGAGQSGIAGKGMQAAGGSLKALGGLANKMGPLIQSLSKLGPILGVVGGGIMAAVKLLIDAQAQAKEFQKDLLASASTAEYLARAGGDADLAYFNLSRTVRAVRDAAHDFDFNDAWGISPEVHKAAMNALNQEGVSLAHIESQAQVAGKSMKEFSQSMVAVSVAYSRHFGVPLQEVNNFQAEMMTELGMTLETTQMAFSQMTRSATESGIATNRFFSMIKGVSQNLSLYNVRLDSTVKLFGLLTKVMNPRNAQQFMNSVMGAMKGMGQDERMKVALLAGGKGKAIVEKDINKRREHIHSEIGKAIGKQADDVAEALNDPNSDAARALWEEVRAKAGEKAGSLREAAIELQIDTTAKDKGAYGRAFAMENLNVGSSLDMMTAAFAGGKDLSSQAGNLGMHKMAELVGISSEQLRGFMKLEAAVKDQRHELKAQGEKELTEAAAIADKEEKAKAEAAAQHKIDVALTGDTQDILDTLSQEEQKVMEDATKSEMDFAKEQGALIQTMADRLKNLIDFLMNQLYNVFLDIYDTLLDIPMLGGDTAAKKAKLAALRAGGVGEGSKEIVDAVAGKEGPDVKKAIEGTKTYAEFSAALAQPYVDPAAQEKNLFDLNTMLQEDPSLGDDPQFVQLLETSRASLEETKRQAALSQKALAELGLQLGGRWKETAFGSLVQPETRYTDIRQALKGVGITDKRVAGAASSEIEKQIASGGEVDIATALRNAGVSAEDTAKVQEALLSKLSGEQLAAVTAAFGAENEKLRVETSKGAEASKTTAETLTSQNTAYFAFSPRFLSGDFKQTLNESFLESLRTALFEYYMYSDLDRESLAKAIHVGKLTPSDFSQKVGEAATRGALPNTISSLLQPGTPASNAFGGDVSHISREGLAIFKKPSPGEGVTGIRPGERIVPAYERGGGGGGGSTSVVVSLSPDAQKLIQAEVQHGIYEHESRKRTAG